MNYTEVINKMADTIEKAIEKAIEKGKVDRSYQARVVEDKGNKHYVVKFNGNERSARGYRDNISVGDVVIVCVPQNNWNNLYIV